MAHMTLISDDFLDSTAKVPTLLGGRSRLTGEIKFPCPKGASAEDFEPIPLKTEGTLWAYTVQRFPPGKPFVGVTDRNLFKPFGVGYVELDGQVIVETRIVTNDLKALKVGLPMRLVLETFERGDGGADVTSYAFTPSHEVQP